MRNLGLRAQVFCLACKLLIIRNHGTTATTGNRLVSVKTECTQLTKSPGMFSFIAASQRFGGILYENDVPFFANRGNFIHAAWQSERMHGYARLYASARILIVTISIVTFACILIEERL